MITQCDIDVRYPDCDAMGIVHHAVYPIWYEIARMDFFEKMGFAYPDMHALGVDPPMVSLELKYRRPGDLSRPSDRAHPDAVLRAQKAGAGL